MNLKVKLTTIIALLFSVMIFAQDSYTLSGTVKSADDMPIPGANILIVGTTKGASTDFDGNFQITVASGDVLQISYLGYKTQTVIIDNQKTLNVILAEDTNALDEVVVVGYGTQKKSHLTGAISKVKNEKLDQIAVSRVDDALVGQVSGVNIQATNAEAGGAPTITIRGVGSISADSGPAVVVDGIVVSSEFLGNLDMNDVESFEVLKDAASAAIYGSEGANGVIMITTKSGKEGKTKFGYQTYTGFKTAHGSDDYRKSVSDWADRELAATGTLSGETLYAQLLVSTTGIDRDWQDVFFNGGTVTSHSFAARGGSESTKFSTSLRYLHDEGVVITDDYKLLTGNAKIDTKLGKKFKFGVSVTPSYTKQRRLPTSIHNPLRQSPWLPIYHTEETLQFVNRDDPTDNYYFPDVQVGDYFREEHLRLLDLDNDGSRERPRTSGDSNPYAQYVEREHYEYNTKLYGSTYLSWKIIDGLTAKTSLGITLEQRKRERWDGTKHHAAGASRAQFNLQNRYRTRVISDNTLNYSKSFGKHEFDVLAGMTIQKRRTEDSNVTASGYANDLLPNLNGATLFEPPLQYNLQQNKIGYFGRINYAYDDKYLLSASYRRDGSSVFGIDSKWGNFPAVSVGWNVHNEDFLVDSEIINRLKFRVSYGFTGSENFNVDGIAELDIWPYLSLLQNGNAIVDGGITNGVSPANIANTLLQWEASEEFNPAVDFGLFNNRISGSIDYYQRTSDKLLLDNPVSYITGFSGGIVNLGKVQNRGWELELRTKNITREKFSWSTTFIASTNQNELLSFGDSNNALVEDTYGRNSQWINRVGEPISSFWGYVVDTDAYNDTEFRTNYVSNPWNRINGEAEDTIVKDLNGDGIITEEDKTILGDPYPDLVYSFTNEFQIGAFDFSFMVQGSLGAQVNNIGDQYFYNWFGNPTSSGGAAQAVADGVIPHESFIQEKVLTSEVIASADYFSLRNVSLGYNMPSDLVSQIGLSGVRIYATAQNLLYITADDYHGFNPEHDDNGDPRAYGSQRAGTPIYKTISFGLNVDF